MTAPEPDGRELSARPRSGVRDGARALGAAVLFGASTPVAKSLVAGVDPLLLAGLLYLGSGLGLLALRAVRGRSARAHEAGLVRSDLPYLAASTVAGGALAPILLMAGVRAGPASDAALLLNLEAVFTAVIARWVFRESVGRRVAVGMAVILAGSALLTAGAGGAGHSALGALLVAGACLCWAVDNNVTQKISARDPVQIAGIKGLAAGGVNVAIAFALGAPRPAVGITVAALTLGFVSYGLSLVLFVGSLRTLGAARTGAYFSVAPFVGALASVLALHEPVTGWLVGAGVLMAAGVGIQLSERHEHEHVHEPMAHEHAHVHDEHHRHEHAPGVDPAEPHSHWHEHGPLTHRHAHYPDAHHRHEH